jgi:hypothetical protein
MSDKVEQTEPVVQSEQVEQEDGLTLNEIVGLRNIVNLASRRGAFSAEEFKDIGTIYDKVDKFIKKNVKTTPNSDESTENSVVEGSEQKTES